MPSSTATPKLDPAVKAERDRALRVAEANDQLIAQTAAREVAEHKAARKALRSVPLTSDQTSIIATATTMLVGARARQSSTSADMDELLMRVQGQAAAVLSAWRGICDTYEVDATTIRSARGLLDALGTASGRTREELLDGGSSEEVRLYPAGCPLGGDTVIALLNAAADVASHVRHGTSPINVQAVRAGLRLLDERNITPPTVRIPL